jgi:hypothetical protein
MLTRGGRRRESWLESHNLLSGVIRTQRRDANSNRVVGPSAKLLNGLQVKHQCKRHAEHHYSMKS